MSRRPYPAVALTAALVLAGCGQPPPPLQPPEPPTVTVAHPVERTLDSYAEFTGRLAPVETQEVRAQVTGYLKTVYFETPAGGVLNGGTVKEGDKLYEIDPEPYDAALASARAALAKATADVGTADAQQKQAKADLDRATASGAATSKQDKDRFQAAFDTAVATGESAKAAITSAKAQIQKAEFDRKNCTIYSSVKGTARVSRTAVTPGNLVQAGQTLLCTVTSLDPIHAYWDVDEQTSLEYRRKVFDTKELADPRTRARLKCFIAQKDEKTWTREGEVDYIAPEINRATATREIRGLFKNPDYRLGGGDSVRVRVESGKPKSYILVPEPAVGSQQRQKFVYVVTDKDEVEFRPVVLGPVRETPDGPMQVIESGVTPTDRIIVNGLLRVRPGAKVVPKPAAPAASDKKAA